MGWRTVLGQIDPGPPEEAIVQRLCEENGCNGKWKPAPPAYWIAWREECQLADKIVVNSVWSKKALLQEGVLPEKIQVVPLAYESTNECYEFQRDYPKVFDYARPLRVLFLGQINLRKGMQQVLEAVCQLEVEPIEFWFVGPVQIEVPPKLRDNPRIHWIGPIARGETAKYYRQADVFLFPTFSDGFGLTQLVAQAWKLPVIASHFCGDVVQDGVNGYLLPEVSADAITKVLRELIGNSNRLSELSARSGVDGRFRLKALAAALLKL